ncbi:hypothetical protein PVAP13_5KG663707 [Panicum virgatum]|uniref:Uncharacterized protein n=1 Tax=Panicum virgatum TaxID=38727 RepID=A0A8T0SY57_PANVG|nr:hypothetical protein PVAP13_5KG663707 [Panicum virgatum]
MTKKTQRTQRTPPFLLPSSFHHFDHNPTATRKAHETSATNSFPTAVGGRDGEESKAPRHAPAGRPHPFLRKDHHLPSVPLASRRAIRSVPFVAAAAAPRTPATPPKAAAVAVPSIPPARPLSHPSKPNPMVPPVDRLRHRRPRRLLGPRAPAL